jgi:hypothetical protein
MQLIGKRSLVEENQMKGIFHSARIGVALGEILRRHKRQRSRQGLFLDHLEDVSWRLLDHYRDIVRDLIRRRCGIYILYRKRRPYYIGLASNLMGRVNSHLKDRHKGYWDRFSVYLTSDDEHIKALESLLLRIVEPRGNRQSGKFPGTRNLLALLNRRMTETDADRRARLLGGAVAERRLRTQAKKGRAALVFAKLSERRVALQGTYKGRRYRASLRRNGTIRLKGRTYPSPTAAASSIVKRPVNGLWFWHYRNKARQWVKLRTLIQ